MNVVSLQAERSRLSKCDAAQDYACASALIGHVGRRVRLDPAATAAIRKCSAATLGRALYPNVSNRRISAFG
ncbi:hypothetical protein [Lysobacter sp. TAB13]|uniref:hypothetical protein n=1 Tax=Lysobacter sp. TAB13 TaxID=3233065 RepID=UPI003F9DB969